MAQHSWFQMLLRHNTILVKCFVYMHTQIFPSRAITDTAENNGEPYNLSPMLVENFKYGELLNGFHKKDVVGDSHVIRFKNNRVDGNSPPTAGEVECFWFAVSWFCGDKKNKGTKLLAMSAKIKQHYSLQDKYVGVRNGLVSVCVSRLFLQVFRDENLNVIKWSVEWQTGWKRNKVCLKTLHWHHIKISYIWQSRHHSRCNAIHITAKPEEIQIPWVRGVQCEHGWLLSVFRLSQTLISFNAGTRQGGRRKQAKPNVTVILLLVHVRSMQKYQVGVPSDQGASDQQGLMC